MSAGFSDSPMMRGGFAGAIPMSPLKRSKRIWMGVAIDIDAKITRSRAHLFPARPGQADRRNPPRRRRPGKIPMRQLLLDFTRAPEPTFANFVPGGNAELLHALAAAARGEGSERVIYIWGESGAGKSHLARAFEAALAPGRQVRILDDVERLGEAEQVELFDAFNERVFDFLLVTARAAPREVPLRRDLATRLATGL